jgi:hypothetical protein
MSDAWSTDKTGDWYGTRVEMMPGEGRAEEA